MVTFFKALVVFAAPSKAPVPLIPPLSEPFDRVNWLVPFIVSAPVKVALPLSVNEPPTFMSSTDRVAPLATDAFPVVVIEYVLPESVWPVVSKRGAIVWSCAGVTVPPAPVPMVTLEVGLGIAPLPGGFQSVPLEGFHVPLPTSQA